MKIDDNAILKTCKEIEIRAPIDAVWDIQTNINTWSSWQPDISESKLNGMIEQGTNFQWKSGGFKLHSVIESVEKYKIFGWKGAGFGASAIHIWEFESLENGNTIVRTCESMNGWLVRLLKSIMKNKLNESLETWLSALKESAESM